MSCKSRAKCLVPVIRLEKAVESGRHHVLPEEVFERLLKEDIWESELLRKYRISRHVWYTSKHLYGEKYREQIKRLHRNRLSLALTGNKNGERPPSEVLSKERIQHLLEAGNSLPEMSRALKVSEFLVRRNIAHHGLAREGTRPQKLNTTDMETLKRLDLLSPGLLKATKNFSERPAEFFDVLYTTFAGVVQHLWFIQSLAKRHRYYREKNLIPKSHVCWSMNKAELQLSIALLDAGIPHTRQHFVGRYMADFAFPKAHLIVEVDGEYHKVESATKQRDARKESMMISRGWKVLHFTTKQVEKNLDRTLLAIRRELSSASSP